MSRMSTGTAIGMTGMLTAWLCAGSVALAGEAYDLTFTGDASFNGAHGGQTVTVAVVHAGSGNVVERMSATVSASDDPAFSVEFADLLQDGDHYQVHYWIDSNFGGGSEGTCDPKGQDHQWSVDLGTVTGSVTHREEHKPGATTAVCDTFAM